MRQALATTERGDQSRRLREAFGLIELIGVLAVLALVAGLVATVSLRHLDRVASEQEMVRLEALGDALQKSILRTRSIPSHTNWAAVVAAEVGLGIGSVTNNVRNHPRILVVDSGGWLSNSLPYTQSFAGTPALPAKARVMLLSSLGKALPITSGMLNPLDFQELWDAPPGTVPWTFWTGDPDDVKINRVNLSPHFVQLVLTTYSSGTNGQYAVDSSAIQQVPFTNGFAAYFLKGSVLKLYGGSPGNVFDGTQVLDSDESYVFENGKWQDTVVGRVVVGVGDVSGVVAAFLAATPNERAQDTNGNAQQVMVVQNMISYLSNYNAWADQGFPSGAMKNHLENTVQPDLMESVWGLYGRIGGNDYYPTNSGL